jgi:O-antigen ligase
MDFILFLLVNLTLFVRPGELIPDLEGLPIYNYLILATLVSALPRVAEHLRPERLVREPLTACILAMVPVIVLSHLTHFDLWSARVGAFTFSKSVVYYLVLISVVNSSERLRLFLYAIALFAALNSAIAVSHYYGIITIESIKITEEHMIDPETDEPYVVPRLCATGLFGDPNDLSMITVAGVVICLLAMDDKRMGLFRIAWTIPLALFFATLVLTKSRGGMLAFAAAAMMLSYLRFGKWKTIAAAAVLLPALALGVGGRQTDMSSGFQGGTGQARIELWADGLVEMKNSPLFGTGFKTYSDHAGLVAHNSFIHTFVELGVIGGGLFLGAFWFAARSFWKIHRRIQSEYRLTTNLAFRQMLPFLATMLCGFSVSMFSLSRAYVEPTYLALGVANAYFLEAARLGIPAPVRVNARRMGELACVSVGFLLVVYLFIKINIR